MAAKKIQDYVRGKISTTNIGPIHFSSNQSNINIPKTQKLFDERDIDFLTSDPDMAVSSSPTKTPDTAVPEPIPPSSTKSSPGSKPKWGSHISEVTKNINNAVEDARSTLNTLFRDQIVKSDSKTNLSDSEYMVSTEMKQTIPLSSTMPNIDKITDNTAIIPETDVKKKSFANQPQEEADLSDNSNIKSKDDTDNMFDSKKVLAQSQDQTTRSKHTLTTTKVGEDSILSFKARRELTDNFRFPTVRIESDRGGGPKETFWRLDVLIGLIGFAVLLFLFSAVLWLAFALGFISCLLLLFYWDLVNGWYGQRRILSLPTLRELSTPKIPHIQETGHETLDVHASSMSSYGNWVNMIGIYDVNAYNINFCQVVHIDIEGNKLRIRRPRRKIPRRAMWNDSHFSNTIFSCESFIDLESAKVNLLPDGLVHKRLWSKKYPIQLVLPKKINKYNIDKSFHDILHPKSDAIYFFGRTCREKEELYRRLLYACSNPSVDLNMWQIILKFLSRQQDIDGAVLQNNVNRSPDLDKKRSSTNSSDDDFKKITYQNLNKDDADDVDVTIEKAKSKGESIPRIAEYVKYMSKFMPDDLFILASDVMRLDINYVSCDPELLCLNAFLGRIFWDFLRGDHWVEVIRNKIQCKLKKMHLPQFMDELTVVDIHLGKELPLIRKFGRPYLDSRGLWCDASVCYTGGFSMILETKVNLFNLRNQARRNLEDDTAVSVGSFDETLESGRPLSDTRPRSQSAMSKVDKTAAFASSEEDSAESSTNSEESGEDRQSTITGMTTSGSSKRFIKWVDKITRSSYFMKAADNKYIQRGMELVSNTKLMLQVELHAVSGTLALNIPPPPSDRLWFGFRPNPLIKITAKPKVGQKEISFSKVTEIIEKKLTLEFERVLVLPNMEDVHVPLLVNGSIEKYSCNL